MSEHIASKSLYYSVFAGLIFCTGLTVAVAFVNLGDWNIVVALLIAGVKASLVVMFFMHVKWSSKLTKMFVVVGLCWLGLMIGITMTDYLSRAWLTYVP